MNPTKPFFIEVFSDDLSLLNKYKFVLPLGKIKELKEQIRLKLISKKDIEPDTEFSLKDNDDFELGSDDEANDVIPDCKVRIYKKKNNSIVANIQPIPLVVQNAPLQAPVQPPVAVQNIPVVSVDSLVAVSPLLDIKNLNIPIIAEGQLSIKVICPQIRKAVIEIPYNPNIQTFA